MLDSLTLTQTLALLIGLYFAAAGIGVLRDPPGVSAMFESLKSNPLLGYFGAVMAFVIGGAIVAVHNDWSTWLAGFVSFVGWVALLEGVLMLVARVPFINAVERLANSEEFVKVLGGATAVAGAILLWCALG